MTPDPGVPLDICPAEPGDVPAVTELAARTFPLACPPELDRAAVDSFIAANLDESSFHAYLRAPDHTVLVARARDAGPGGAIVAYALLVDGTTMDEACAEMIHARPTVGVSKFYLDPALHGRGAALALLDGVLTCARERGASSLWLATNVGNARALGFYRKGGFVSRGERDFLVGGVRNRDVVLERPL